MAGPDRELEIRIYTGADARFTLYDDAGDGYGHEQGEYAPLHPRLGPRRTPRCTSPHARAPTPAWRRSRRSASGSSAPGPNPRNRPSAIRANPSTANSNQPKTDETHPNHSLSDAAPGRRFGRGTGQIHGQRRLAFHERLALQRLPARGRRLGVGGGEHPPHVERRGRRRRRSGLLPRPGMVPQADRPAGRRRPRSRSTSASRGPTRWCGSTSTAITPGSTRAATRASCSTSRNTSSRGGENLFAAEVDNAHDPDIPPLSADFTFFGGIYRDVSLLMTDKVHVAPTDFASPGRLPFDPRSHG